MVRVLGKAAGLFREREESVSTMLCFIMIPQCFMYFIIFD